MRERRLHEHLDCSEEGIRLIVVTILQDCLLVLFRARRRLWCLGDCLDLQHLSGGPCLLKSPKIFDSGVWEHAEPTPPTQSLSPFHQDLSEAVSSLATSIISLRNTVMFRMKKLNTMMFASIDNDACIPTAFFGSGVGSDTQETYWCKMTENAYGIELMKKIKDLPHIPKKPPLFIIRVDDGALRGAQIKSPSGKLLSSIDVTNKGLSLSLPVKDKMLNSLLEVGVTPPSKSTLLEVQAEYCKKFARSNVEALFADWGETLLHLKVITDEDLKAVVDAVMKIGFGSC